MKKINTKIPMPKIPVPKVTRIGLPKVTRIAGVTNPYRVNKLR